MRVLLIHNWAQSPRAPVLTFDGAVLLLDLHDPWWPWLARRLEGDAGLLLQALLPEVVRAALVASPALGKFKLC